MKIENRLKKRYTSGWIYLLFILLASASNVKATSIIDMFEACVKYDNTARTPLCNTGQYPTVHHSITIAVKVKFDPTNLPAQRPGNLWVYFENPVLFPGTPAVKMTMVNTYLGLGGRIQEWVGTVYRPLNPLAQPCVNYINDNPNYMTVKNKFYSSNFTCQIANPNIWFTYELCDPSTSSCTGVNPYPGSPTSLQAFSDVTCCNSQTPDDWDVIDDITEHSSAPCIFYDNECGCYKMRVTLDDDAAQQVFNAYDGTLYLNIGISWVFGIPHDSWTQLPNGSYEFYFTLPPSLYQYGFSREKCFSYYLSQVSHIYYQMPLDEMVLQAVCYCCDEADFFVSGGTNTTDINVSTDVVVIPHPMANKHWTVDNSYYSNNNAETISEAPGAHSICLIAKAGDGETEEFCTKCLNVCFQEHAYRGGEDPCVNTSFDYTFSTRDKSLTMTLPPSVPSGYIYKWSVDGVFKAIAAVWGHEVIDYTPYYNGHHTVCVDVYQGETYVCSKCIDLCFGDGEGERPASGNSGITAVSGTELKSKIELHPNPAENYTTLTVETPGKTSLQIQVTDIAGRVVEETKSQNLAAGTYRFDINTSQLTSGLYHVKVITSDGVKTMRLLIAK